MPYRTLLSWNVFLRAVDYWSVLIRAAISWQEFWSSHDWQSHFCISLESAFDQTLLPNGEYRANANSVIALFNNCEVEVYLPVLYLSMPNIYDDLQILFIHIISAISAGHALNAVPLPTNPSMFYSRRQKCLQWTDRVLALFTNLDSYLWAVWCKQ